MGLGAWVRSDADQCVQQLCLLHRRKLFHSQHFRPRLKGSQYAHQSVLEVPDLAAAAWVVLRHYWLCLVFVPCELLELRHIHGLFKYCHDLGLLDTLFSGEPVLGRPARRWLAGQAVGPGGEALDDSISPQLAVGGLVANLLIAYSAMYIFGLTAVYIMMALYSSVALYAAGRPSNRGVFGVRSPEARRWGLLQNAQ